MERYQDLALEVKRIHRNTKKTVIAIVIDALRTISKNARPGMRGSVCRAFFCTVVSHPWHCSYIAESGCVSKLQEAAETYGIFQVIQVIIK